MRPGRLHHNGSGGAALWIDSVWSRLDHDGAFRVHNALPTIRLPDRSTMTISVIIPAWNEASTIVGCLRAIAAEAPHEIIVVDAGSPDGTGELARGTGLARVIESDRGRALQQNAGASHSTGDLLLFLHADCRIEPGALGAAGRFLRDNPRVPAACFRMQVPARNALYRPIEAAAHLRAGVLGLPYGDQGLLARRDAFFRVGGFPDAPIMEDLILAQRLSRLGRIALLASRIVVSDRRWRRQGIVRQTLRNWILTGLHGAGVSATTLARHYPAVR
jgi:rSAM/selenodomain-associated transferase 2